MKTLFLDSNVIIDGILSRWGLSKAILSLCAERLHRLYLAEYVSAEVERTLLSLAYADARRASQILKDYDRWLTLSKPRWIPEATEAEVLAASRLIRHLHDAPVLAAALKSRPDFLISRNEKHFNKTVGARTGLVIVTPREFFALVH